MAESIHNVENRTEITKLYKERWLMLLLYIFYCASSLIQHYHYMILSHELTQYYGVSYTTITWSHLIMLIMYTILSFPGNYFVNIIGLRNAVLVGTVGTTVGTAIKFFAVHPDRFWVAIFAQGILSVFYICMLPVLPKLTATWFGIKEIATANALGLAGIQFSTAFSVRIPPLIVFEGKNDDDIARRLNYLNIVFTGFSIFMTILVYFFFSNEPPIPPSVAHKKLNEEKQNQETFGFLYTCKQLFSHKSYLIFIFVYAINTNSIDQMKLYFTFFLHGYPIASLLQTGVIEFLLYFVGIHFAITGSLSVGVILDKCKNFKMTVYTLYAITFLSVALFIGIHNQGIHIHNHTYTITFLYLTTFIMGCFWQKLNLAIILLCATVLGWACPFIADACLFSSVVEIVMELTYPLPENITFGLAIIAANIGRVVIVPLYNTMFGTVGIFWANFAILVLLFVTNLGFYFVKFDLKRHSVENFTVTENIQLGYRRV